MSAYLERHRDHLRRLFLFFIYFFASWVVVVVFIAFPRLNGNPPRMFQDMVYGTAHRPFVYRALVPTTIRLITEVTPDAVIQKVESAASYKRPLKRLVDVSRIPAEYVYEYLVGLAIIYCCIFGFAVTMRRLIKAYYPYHSFIPDLAPLGALLIMPAFFRYDNTLYDMATVVLSALALLMITKRRILLFYPIFLLAAINKETAALLVAIFVLYQWRQMKRPVLAAHVVIMLALWLGLRLWIMNQFTDNPGGTAEIHLLDHNLTLFAHAFQSVYFIVFMGLFSLLLAYRWRSKPLILRRGFMLSFLPLFLTGMVFAYIDEVRVYI